MLTRGSGPRKKAIREAAKINYFDLRETGRTSQRIAAQAAFRLKSPGRPKATTAKVYAPPQREAGTRNRRTNLSGHSRPQTCLAIVFGSATVPSPLPATPPPMPPAAPSVSAWPTSGGGLLLPRQQWPASMSLAVAEQAEATPFKVPTTLGAIFQLNAP